jgi:hypothetical protein
MTNTTNYDSSQTTDACSGSHASRVACKTCRFFCFQEDYWGDCRRNPPRRGLNGPEWPSVRPGHWCGKYRSRLSDTFADPQASPLVNLFHQYKGFLDMEPGDSFYCADDDRDACMGSFGNLSLTDIPVRILISEGTSREDAIRLLRKLVAGIEERGGFPVPVSQTAVAWAAAAATSDGSDPATAQGKGDHNKQIGPDQGHGDNGSEGEQGKRS